jgi:hypothetical protein
MDDGVPSAAERLVCAITGGIGTAAQERNEPCEEKRETAEVGEPPRGKQSTLAVMQSHVLLGLVQLVILLGDVEGEVRAP